MRCRFENRRGESSARELFRAGSGFSRLVIIRELPTLHPSSNECRFEKRIPDLERSLPEERRGLREADAAGRDADLSGKVAKALLEKAPELLAEPPKIEKADVLADR